MEGFMSVTPWERRKEPRADIRKVKMQDLLQLKQKTLENQGVRPSFENVAIILDFLGIVKVKNLQIIRKIKGKIVTYDNCAG